MSRVDAVLLDLDGTVLDSHDLIVASYLHTCAVHELEADVELFRRGIGRPLEEILAGLATEVDPAHLAQTYRAHSDLHHDTSVRLFPGMRAVLDGLRARGKKVAIVTSKTKSFAARGLEVVGLEVDLLVGPRDAAHPKPAPDPVLFALEQLGVAPERALMVGDAPSDLLAGRAAQVRTVAVRWTGLPHAELEACGPDHWIDVPGDLEALVDDPTDIAVVDDANRFVRWTDRADVHGHHLPHRSVHVLLFTPEGALVVQRRHPDKLTWPSHWDVSVAGHVERSDYPAGPDERLDEVYAAVAARELEEELGVRAPLRLLGAFGPEPGVHYEQLHLFHAVHAGPFRIQPEEVAEVRAVPPEALEALEPKTHALRHWWRWWTSHGGYR
ncbi:MAG: HAD-IA family hydrolase [Myxococcales bacterium]|nr:HAD-IA family hydrolase [Myxococcales bacterium]